MRDGKIYLINNKACIEYYTLGKASLKRCMEEYSRLNKLRHLTEEKFNEHVCNYYDEQIEQIIERLNRYGNTTCSDATLKYFGGTDGLIRTLREKYFAYVWISLKTEDNIPIIEYLDYGVRNR